MRKLLLCGLLCLAVALFTSCSREETVTEPDLAATALQEYAVDPELLAGEIVLGSGWEYDAEIEVPAKLGLLDDDGARCRILDFEREVLVGNIVHYSWVIPVGDGENDIIRLHRVVKEQRPYRPIRTKRNIFLQHGDAVGFVKFLFGVAAPSVPDDHAVAVYLAQNRVDVWGIDQNWALVPAETTDFSFMADWGMDNQVCNLRTGMAVARFVRFLTGSSHNKMHLLGYSSGVWLGFSLLNAEAVMPEWQRHAKGFVAADAFTKCGPDNESGRLAMCEFAEITRDLMEDGEYAEPIPFALMADLAMTDPDGDSPVFPGLTNEQAVLLYGCATWRLAPFNSWWHYWGSVFDGDPEDPTSMPTTDLHFTPYQHALEFMATGSPWEARAFILDYYDLTCDVMDVPWDDNYADITVPILNYGGAGGLAPSADFALSLLGSDDIENLIVQLLPDEQKYEDYGHIDIWTGTDAAPLAWQPLLHWIRTHNDGNH